MSTEVLRLVHGSHLYGLANSNSDLDVYVVHAQARRPHQKVTGGLDVTSLGWPQFMEQACRGVPQALEAMFAPDDLVEVDPYRAVRTSFRVAGAEAMDRMRRTIASFHRAGDDKRRRHAVRLALAYDQVRRTGRFTPRLSASEKDVVLASVDMSRLETVALVNDLAGVEVIHEERSL